MQWIWRSHSSSFLFYSTNLKKPVWCSLAHQFKTRAIFRPFRSRSFFGICNFGFALLQQRVFWRFSFFPIFFSILAIFCLIFCQFLFFAMLYRYMTFFWFFMRQLFRSSVLPIFGIFLNWHFRYQNKLRFKQDPPKALGELK